MQHILCRGTTTPSPGRKTAVAARKSPHCAVFPGFPGLGSAGRGSCHGFSDGDEGPQEYESPAVPRPEMIPARFTSGTLPRSGSLPVLEKPLIQNYLCLPNRGQKCRFDFNHSGKCTSFAKIGTSYFRKR